MKKNIKIYTVLLMSLCLCINLHGQQKNSPYWYFGGNLFTTAGTGGTGLDFTGFNLVNGHLLPNKVNGVQNKMPNNNYNSVAVDKKTGKILFYTNGVRVYNDKNELVPEQTDFTEGKNGSDVLTLVVPIENNPNQFYLIINPTGWVSTAGSSGYMCYYIYDTTLNNGVGGFVKGDDGKPLKTDLKGQITVRKGTLDSTKVLANVLGAAGGMSIVSNDTGTISWLLNYTLGNMIAWKIGKDGINPTPVVSLVDSPQVNNIQNYTPFMTRFAPDGKTLYAFKKTGGMLSGAQFAKMDFDVNTGIASNFTDDFKFKQGVDLSETPYSFEISSNGENIFLGGSTGMLGGVAGWGLRVIKASDFGKEVPVRVTGTGTSNVFALQLASDGRMYAMNSENGTLSFVLNPDESDFSKIVYVDEADVLGNGYGSYLFPTMNARGFAADVINTCANYTVSISIPNIYPQDPASGIKSLTWNFGDGNSVTVGDLDLTAPFYTQSHLYTTPGKYTGQVSLLDASNNVLIVKTFVANVEDCSSYLQLSGCMSMNTTISTSFESSVNGAALENVVFDFGDGSDTEVQTATAGANGSQAFTTNHVYNNVSVYLAKITAYYSDGSSQVINASINISDCETEVAKMNGCINQNFSSIAVQNGPVSTNPGDAVKVFCDYGDGRIVELPFSDNPIGVYQVDNVSYPESGFYIMNFYKVNKDSTRQSFATLEFTIANCIDLYLSGCLNMNTKIETSFASSTGTATLEKVTFDFGDGSDTEIQTATAGANGSQAFTTNHVYNNIGVYAVKITATYSDGSIKVTNASMNITDCETEVAKMNGCINQNFSSIAVQNGPVSTNPGDAVKVFCDYGDGRVVELPFSDNPIGVYQVDNVSYSESGFYIMNFYKVNKDSTRQSFATLEFTINNCIDLYLSGCLNMNTKIETSFASSIGTATLEKVTFDFGDGSTSDTQTSTSESVTPTFESNHIYTNIGVYAVKITATYSDGSIKVTNASMNITDCDTEVAKMNGCVDQNFSSIAVQNGPVSTNPGDAVKVFCDYGDGRVVELPFSDNPIGVYQVDNVSYSESGFYIMNFYKVNKDSTHQSFATLEFTINNCIDNIVTNPTIRVRF